MNTASNSEFLTSATLLLRLRPDGEQHEIAWAEFHRRYAPMIAGFAHKLGARGPDADDLVQDVLVQFFGAAEKFRYDPSRGRFRSFLKTCVFHQLLKNKSRSAKFQGVPIDQVDPQSAEVDTAWERVWQDEQLRRALEELRQRYSANEERQRTFRAFELYVLQAKPQEQVASELGISVDSVHQAKHRLTAALQKIVRDLEESEG